MCKCGINAGNKFKPAEQANERRLSPSSVGSWTLQPSSRSFLTAPTSPSRQASARLRAPT